MRRGKINLRPGRHDASGIDLQMALVIVPFDVIGTKGRGDGAGLIKIPDIGGKIRIVGYAPDITFEMADVDEIKTEQRREQPDIGLGDAVAAEIAAPREPLLQEIQCGE